MAKLNLFISVPDADLLNQVLALSCIPDCEVSLAESADNWLQEAAASDADAVIARVDGFSADDLEQLAESGLTEQADVIFLSDGTPNEYVDQAMLTGASYHLRTPLEADFLNELIEELIAETAAEQGKSVDAVRSELDQFGLLLGSSKPMRKLFRVIRKAAASHVNVLVNGESGVGKELVANTIHLMSDRRDQEIMTLNCGAISPELIESELFGHVKGAFTGATETRTGIFEQADGSTLFLDEVTEMPLEQQVKLLRVLETGEFKKVGSNEIQHCDVRVVSATNRDPAQAINDEIFREDLYFRLAQFPIKVPPLRARGEDIVGLAQHFLAYRNNEENTATVISEAALEKLSSHAWPGNVRDLKYTIERAYILAESVIEANHILLDSLEEPTTSLSVPEGLSLEEIEKQAILTTLDETGGKKNETAERLGISVKTLYNKLEKYKADES
ncbi:MAG: sigma-54-dependent transcriptional regulator [Pseudomonadales bacterium]